MTVSFWLDFALDLVRWVFTGWLEFSHTSQSTWVGLRWIALDCVGLGWNGMGAYQIQMTDWHGERERLCVHCLPDSCLSEDREVRWVTLNRARIYHTESYIHIKPISSPPFPLVFVILPLK